jgi:hypothetical protein
MSYDEAIRARIERVAAARGGTLAEYYVGRVCIAPFSPAVRCTAIAAM